MAKYSVWYGLAAGYTVTGVVDAISQDDAWQQACSTLDDLIPRFDDRNLQVKRERTATPMKRGAPGEDQADETEAEVMAFLNQDGQHILLLGRQRAYLSASPDDYTTQRVPIRAVRHLIETGQLALWRAEPQWVYHIYRSAAWVAAHQPSQPSQTPDANKE